MYADTLIEIDDCRRQIDRAVAPFRPTCNEFVFRELVDQVQSASAAVQAISTSWADCPTCAAGSSSRASSAGVNLPETIGSLVNSAAKVLPLVLARNAASRTTA